MEVLVLLWLALAGCAAAPDSSSAATTAPRAEVAAPVPVPAPASVPDASSGTADAAPAASETSPAPDATSSTPSSGTAASSGTASNPSSAATAATASTSSSPSKAKAKTSPGDSSPSAPAAEAAPETTSPTPPATSTGTQAAVTTPPAPAPRGLTTYDLQPSKSTVYVLIKYDRSSALGGALGHDHTVAATTWTGTVKWDPTDASKCVVDIQVPVSGLHVDPAGYRQKAGLDGEISDDDKAKIEDNFRGKRQLDASSFPTISWHATSCDATSGTVHVTGDMTIHGVTKHLTVPMAVSEDGATFSAHGQVGAKTEDFGFDPYTNVGGMLRNDDALLFVVDVKGKAE